MVISSRGEDRAELTLFTAQAHEARIRSIVSLEACKEKQLEFLEKVAASEGDVVKRTVYVDNVHNIRLEKNRKKLGKFFERYGAVEDCIVARYVGKDVNRVLEPAARVLFYHETSAQEALKKKKKDYPQEDCANGSGTILVSKSHHYNIKKNEREASSIELKADRLCFGHYMPNEKHQPNLPWRMNRDNCALEEWLEEYAMNAEIVVRIDMVQKCVELKAPRLFGSNDKFDFSSASDYATICFKSLWGPIDICRCDGSDRFSLVFALKYPPKFESDTTVVGLGYSVDEQGSDRTRGLSFNRLQSVSTAFGECLGLKLDLVDSTSFRRLLHSEVFATLKDFGIVDGDFQREDDARTIASKQIRLDNGKGHAFVLEEISELHDWNATIDRGIFSWYDAWQDAVVIEMDQLETHYSLFELLKFRIANGFSETIIQALTSMLKSQESTRFPCRLMHQLVQAPLVKSQIPDHAVEIPRVFLTPTRQIAMGFEVETSNQVVREFVEDYSFPPHRFLRVTISDENGRNLLWCDLTDPLRQRIRDIVLPGLLVNGKLFQFLAYSSSQLRESSIWCVNLDDTTWTVPAIRQNMGDFSSCLTASKTAARMGQCFSTTFQGLRGPESLADGGPEVRHAQIPDTLGPGGNGVHSDGNGLIRRSAMIKLLQSTPSIQDGTELHHSIVQMRYGGAKGTLVAWDDHDFDACLLSNKIPNPSEYNVVIRHSMVKFAARYRRLAVCSVGKDAPYYLNRNVIFLLCHHGVAERIFITMQREMLDSLDGMLHCPILAHKMISQLGGPDHVQRTCLLHTLRCGMSPSTDPFVFACCLAIRACHLFGLRKKARIYVKDGAVLMGGLDILNVLPEYCVFLQVRKNRGNREDNDFEPIVGPVMVTKHPVMHPGDVRMLLAVDVPALREHKNVLLFSQRGSRPEADKMSGSDLDGDEFAVTWDPNLFIGEWNQCTRDARGRFVSKKNRILQSFDASARNGDFREAAFAATQLQHANSIPQHYSQPEPNALEALSVTDEALLEFLITFRQRDNLGQMSMRWQDLASFYGAGSSQCLALAEQHSIAVDFAKTGHAATIPDNARWHLHAHPHFREKKNRPSYRCDSVIGKLYDEATFDDEKRKPSAVVSAHAGRIIDRHGQVLSMCVDDSWAKISRYPDYYALVPAKLGWIHYPVDFNQTKLQDHLYAVATELQFGHDDQVVKAMQRYGLRSEGELHTGCIRKFQHEHKSRHHDVTQDVRLVARSILNDSKSSFFHHVLDVVNASSISSIVRVVPPPPGFEGAPAPPYDAHLEECQRFRMCTKFAQIHNLDALTNYSKDELFWAEEVSTSTSPGTDARSWMVRTVARQLAAACFMVTYSPWRCQGVVLYGFPWTVANVIACALEESSSRVPTAH